MNNGEGVVVFDGQCAFCRRSVERIRRRDRRSRLQFLPRDTTGIEQRFPGLVEGDFNTGLRFIDTDGSIYVGADALHRIARQLPRWRRLAWIYRVPPVHWLARKTYAWIAANRMRLSRRCDDGTCSTATPRTDAGIGNSATGSGQ